ncbi:hypothetical protein AX16_004254 [Volvariella volvacea WC 439]|nr:hypothetical protein AX16_004254 [Volvariella volvacea WC 439]
MVAVTGAAMDDPKGSNEFSHDDLRRDPRSLTTLPDILSCLSAFQSEEAELSNALSELLDAREPIANSLARLHGLVPQIETLHIEATALSDKVMKTAETADRVGGKVRSLDEEMSRVREAGERVNQVMELKSSLSALQSAIEIQDWESAARHCARAMSLPPEVVSGPFAEVAVPTAESHLPPAQTLQNARELLLSVFRHNFEQASRSRDSTATTRFFKLFPAIGWEEEGLQAYASFVVDLVRIRAPPSAKTSSPLYFITSLTALFESIAMIVDQHRPVVEKYYGEGRMKIVVQRLLEECDRVVKGIIDGWEEERTMKRRLSDVVNSVPAGYHTPTSNRRQQQQGSMQDESGVDPRDIDRTLTEVSGMVGRWHLFQKFLVEVLHSDENTDDNGKEIQPDKDIEKALERSQSFKYFENLITTYYIPLEDWYTRTTIDKAHRLSTTDSTQYPVASTTPDDVFYILKSVVMRLLSMGSLMGVERMMTQLRDIVDKDYTGVIKRKLDDVYRAAGPNQGSRGEKTDRENRVAFITLLNDLDTSSSHVERLMHDLSTNDIIQQQFVEKHQQTVKDQLSNFANLSSKFRSSLRVGIEQLFNQLMRPRLRTFISDVYRDVSYVLDEDSYALAEYQEVVRKRFVKAWDGLLDGYKDTFTESNYRIFFGLVLDVLLRPWEKLITGMKFTELGAIRFDRDLRAVITHLNAQTAFGDIREKFVRLQQISTVLNLDPEEDPDEFYNGSGIAWKLSANEARAVASLRL